ncbi:MAG TPA: ABC transporter permease subunit [Planctomycetaceae bacterium]|nr:ABC transporter permease subunit [Planctomycetaceae bacterium]
MNRRFANFGLPLLAKELIEQAARKRTYIVRVVYAVILFLLTGLFFYQILQFAVASPLAVLGRGRDMFATLVGVQFAGVYLFMPAMTCGVITQEKERASLQLLFLTRLGPWTILFEKLLGRLVPMLGFLVLSIPLLGFAYTLGGVSRDFLWTGVWLLVLASIQMGSVALMCSAYFRTTVGAFIGSYVLAFLMMFGPYFIAMILYLVALLAGADLERLLREIAPSLSPDMFMLGMFPLFGPMLFFVAAMLPGALGGWLILGHSVIVLAVSGGCLLLARRFLVRRAFLPPRNIVLDAFRRIDRAQLQQARAESSAQAAALSAARLPGDEPIAWRETSKRLLGRGRYVFRILLFIEVPLVLFCLLLIAKSDNFATEILSSMMLFLVWMLSVLVVSVKAASLIAGERSHQTLDVLCTTPLTSREIVLQKFRGVLRLILVLAVPMLTIYLFNARLRIVSIRFRGPEFDPLKYLFCGILAVGVYLPLVAWVSLAIGLRVRTQVRAMIGSLAALVAWCIGPLIFITMPLAIMLRPMPRDDLPAYSALLSPATMVFMNEVTQTEPVNAPPAIVVNFIGYGIALVVIRAVCLSNADRWLGRCEAK